MVSALGALLEEVSVLKLQLAQIHLAQLPRSEVEFTPLAVSKTGLLSGSEVSVIGESVPCCGSAARWMIPEVRLVYCALSLDSARFSWRNDDCEIFTKN